MWGSITFKASKPRKGPHNHQPWDEDGTQEGQAETQLTRAQAALRTVQGHSEWWQHRGTGTTGSPRLLKCQKPTCTTVCLSEAETGGHQQVLQTAVQPQLNRTRQPGLQAGPPPREAMESSAQVEQESLAARKPVPATGATQPWQACLHQPFQCPQLVLTTSQQKQHPAPKSQLGLLPPRTEEK